MFAKPRPKKDVPLPPSKKRKVFHAVEEVNFDFDARADYLTGFRKRKLQRQKEAKAINEEKERQERIKVRKQMRDERKQAVQDHVDTVNRLLKEARESGTHGVESGSEDGEGEDDFGGFEDEPIQPVDLEEEYVDEDKYTNVTIEAVNIDRDGMHKPGEVEAQEWESESEDEDGNKKKKKDDDDGEEDGKKGKKEWPKKTKKKKFRYETKLERQLTERKRKVKAAR